MRWLRTRARRALLVAVLAAAAIAGGLAATASAVSGITVYAASSLTDVFPAIDSAPKYSFAGSNALAAQITLGAPADVFASANTSIPASLYAKGVIEKPVNFTRNTLAVVVPKSNPAGIKSIYDLTKPGIKINEAAASVPVGSYTVQVLTQMGINTAIQANVVSKETSDATLAGHAVPGTG